MRYVFKKTPWPLLLAILTAFSVTACEVGVTGDIVQGGGNYDDGGGDDGGETVCGEADSTDYTFPQPGPSTPKKQRLEAAVLVLKNKCISCHAGRGNLIPNQMYNPNYWNDPCYGQPHTFIGLDFSGYESAMMKMVNKPAGAPAGLDSEESMPPSGGLTLAEFNALWNFVEGLDD